MRVGLQAWGSEGDIQPFTALAAGLVRGGHEVTLVGTDNVGRDYTELGQRFGYRVVAASPLHFPDTVRLRQTWVLRKFNVERSEEVSRQNRKGVGINTRALAAGRYYAELSGNAYRLNRLMQQSPKR